MPVASGQEWRTWTVRPGSESCLPNLSKLKTPSPARGRSHGAASGAKSGRALSANGATGSHGQAAQAATVTIVNPVTGTGSGQQGRTVRSSRPATADSPD